MKKSISHFFLHYGISAVLVVMLAGIICMLHVIEISNKVAVDLQRDGQAQCRAYLPHDLCTTYSVGDTLHLHTYNGTTAAFRLTEIHQEQTYCIGLLSPIAASTQTDALFQGDSKTTGYLVTGKSKLWSLIFSKWQKKVS